MRTLFLRMWQRYRWHLQESVSTLEGYIVTIRVMLSILMSCMCAWVTNQRATNASYFTALVDCTSYTYMYIRRFQASCQCCHTCSILYYQFTFDSIFSKNSFPRIANDVIEIEADDVSRVSPNDVTYMWVSDLVKSCYEIVRLTSC